MENILKKYLKKINVTSFEDLNPEEKETYRQWEESLRGRKITDKDFKDWLDYELDIAVSRITEVDLSKEDEIFRKMEARFIKKILNFINGPKVEKQFAKKTIEQLMNK